MLIFKDNGSSAKEENRFEPTIAINEEDSEYKKMYVDVRTGEEFTPKKQSPNPQELLEVLPEEKHVSKPFNISSVSVKLSESSSSSMSSYSTPSHVKEEEIPEEDFELKKEPIDYEEMPADDEDMEDVEQEIVGVHDEVMRELEETNIEMDEGIKEENDCDENTEIGLTSDIEDTDIEMETVENTLEKCDPNDTFDSQTKHAEIENNHERKEIEIDENSHLSEGSDSEDSDSSSSSSSCSSSSCSSKSSNASNASSNALSDDEDDVEVKESLINPNNED